MPRNRWPIDGNTQLGASADVLREGCRHVRDVQDADYVVSVLLMPLGRTNSAARDALSEELREIGEIKDRDNVVGVYISAHNRAIQEVLARGKERIYLLLQRIAVAVLVIVTRIAE
jgi:hypothetical protein